MAKCVSGCLALPTERSNHLPNCRLWSLRVKQRAERQVTMVAGQRVVRICSCALSDGIPRRSFYVALVVGTILNIINQGDAFLAHASINWFKIILTYLVPYGVCTYGAVYTKLRLGVLVGHKESYDAACR